MARHVIPELNGIRAISILLVLAAHLLPLGPSSWRLNEAAGPMGMSLFFCLSGFLITKFLYEREDVVDFFRRRLARIIPLAVLYAAIVAIVLTYRPDVFAAVVLFYINYYDAALGVPATSHLWSLAVEMHFYAAIGLLVAVLGRKAFWVVPAAAVAVLGLKINSGPEAYVNIRTHYRVDEILSGSLLALLWLRAPRIKPRVATVCLWGGVLLLMVASHPATGPLNFARPYLSAVTVGAALFMSDGAVRSALSSRPLGYIAGISYALYIWHPLMAIGWMSDGDKVLLYLVKRPLTFALTFLAAHISTNTLERYFRTLARGDLKGSRRSIAPTPTPSRD